MRSKTPYNKKRKRVGRGVGSGHGKRSTRGQKGQLSRSGYSRREGFEGGQNPLYRRLPKRGFNNSDFKKLYDIVNVGQLAELEVKEITPEALRAAGLIKGNSVSKVKILGAGDLQKAMTVKAHSFSESAKAKIEKVGGQAQLIEITKPMTLDPRPQTLDQKKSERKSL